MPRDFLYSSLGTHLRFSRDPGSGIRKELHLLVSTRACSTQASDAVRLRSRDASFGVIRGLRPRSLLASIRKTPLVSNRVCDRDRKILLASRPAWYRDRMSPSVSTRVFQIARSWVVSPGSW